MYGLFNSFGDLRTKPIFEFLIQQTVDNLQIEIFNPLLPDEEARILLIPHPQMVGQLHGPSISGFLQVVQPKLLGKELLRLVRYIIGYRLLAEVLAVDGFYNGVVGEVYYTHGLLLVNI